MTSCTVSTSTPNRWPSSVNVVNCWLAASVPDGVLVVVAAMSDLREVGRGRQVEVGVRREDRLADVEQLGDVLLDDGRPDQAVLLEVAAGRELLLGDVEDLLDDEADAAVVLAVDDDLHRVGRLAVAPRAEEGGQPDQRQDLP